MLIVQFERDLFFKFHRQVYCWLDEWFGMSLEDVRNYEAKIKQDLDNVSTIIGVRLVHSRGRQFTVFTLFILVFLRDVQSADSSYIRKVPIQK